MICTVRINRDPIAGDMPQLYLVSLNWSARLVVDLVSVTKEL